MVSSDERPDTVASDYLQQRQSPDGEAHTTQHIHDGGTHALQNEEGSTLSIIPEKSLAELDAGIRISQLDKEGSISSIIPASLSLTTDTRTHASQSGVEVRTRFIREKVLEDGYHWRKYGQKIVKGNEFIRSYYKCTHPSCRVKKQLERSQGGEIVDIIYFGQHDHPKPQLNLPVAVGFVLTVVEEGPSGTLPTVVEGQAPDVVESRNTSHILTDAPSEDVKGVLAESNRIRDVVDNDDDPHSKRRKSDNCSIDLTPVDKQTNEPRLVVQTLSEVDIVNDGYRWRKYGQKLVKGNPNPRSYYRCSSPGCPVKKHVERASHDPKVVVTSYEGQHCHDMPPSRTVTPNVTTTTIGNGESGESDDMSCSNEQSKEELNCESRSKLEGSNITGFGVVAHSISGHENKLEQQPAGNLDAVEEIDSASFVFKTNSVSEGRSNKLVGESKAESKENGSSGSVYTVTTGPEIKPNEQHIPNSEPVKS